MKYLLFIFIFITQLLSLDFKVASYNVENFFDLHYDNTEYKEYIPHTKYWNKKSYNQKLININQVINDLDADILALQEIESKKVLNTLIKNNPSYKYSAFHKNKNSAIGLGLISRYKIISTNTIKVDKNDKFSRDILKVTLLIENKPLIIYVNHWRSKRAKESKRIIYAMALKNEIDKQQNKDYIILGDLNSNYNEYKTFRHDKKLNDTFNITGINQILNTTKNGNFIRKENILSHQDSVHFNPWLELSKKKRFSTKFRKQNNTPDNIILSSSLFDNQNISYINNSFKVFSSSYLFKNKKIYRWNKTKKNGYSDHLPIYLKLSTKKQIYNFPEKIQITHNSISNLYEVNQVSNYKLNNVVVIYSTKKIAIIKHQSHQDAIMIYKPNIELKVGYKYDLTVDKIDEFNGLKEIVKISNVSQKDTFNDYTKLYLDGNKINLNDEKFINNIIYNIQGIYKKRYLYFGEKRIKLYFQKGVKRPKDGTSIKILRGHLSIFRSSMQIVLHRDLDFKF